MGNPLRKNRPRSVGQVMTTIEDIKTYTVHIPLRGTSAESFQDDLEMELSDQLDEDDPYQMELSELICGDDFSKRAVEVVKDRQRQLELKLSRGALEHLISVVEYRTQSHPSIDVRYYPECRALIKWGQRLIDSLTHTLNGTTPPPQPPKPKKPKPLTAKQREKLTKQRHRLLTKEAHIIWKKMEQWHRGKPLPEIIIAIARRESKMGAGWADAPRKHSNWNPKPRIQINIPTEIPDDKQWWVWSVLVHELAHIACPPIKAETGKGWRDNTHHRVFYYCIRHVWEKRLKCELTFKDVKTWGYSVDHIINKQANHLIKFKLPNHKK